MSQCVDNRGTRRGRGKDVKNCLCRMVRMMMALLLTVMGLQHMTLLVSKSRITLIHAEVCLYCNNYRNRNERVININRRNYNSDNSNEKIVTVVVTAIIQLLQ